ncbi:hypothetical protein U9M48_040912 [Paspalum notatum var. saurae]|uniref:Reverse transcriptase domain-containing protein n=1 Tax=Paspalum notatum var. saurae TaxID=547442 RepID=A0AAQ3XE99_PASNO
MTLFEEFHARTLNLYSLNFGTIILLPKSSEAKQIQQYRPICLFNVSFKIFTKVATNRLTQIAYRVIRPSQMAFLPRRNTIEGAVILHEMIHELQKTNGMAYDEVRWDFLQQTLRTKGFFTKGNVGVKVNDQVGSYFETKKEYVMMIHCPPALLFNIVVDMLAIMINRAKDARQFEGLIPHLVQEGLSILQYADDTMIFLEHDIEQAKNLKLLLCTFEHLGSFPFKHLGIPMHYTKLNNKDWALVEDRFEKSLSGWKGKLLSVGGRLVLINFVLSSLPMFMLSFFEVPKGTTTDQGFIGKIKHRKKYRLARWEILCQAKDQEGLGILNLDLQNKCLLSKWLFKLCNEDRVWQQLIRNKYLKNKTLSQDTWLWNQSLKHQYHSLFNIVRNKYAIIAEVLSSSSLNIFFRRALLGDKLRDWHSLVLRVSNITLQEENDVLYGIFMGMVPQDIWRTKLPLKIKIFIWYLKKGVLLTKDNLIRQNWYGDKSYAFCGLCWALWLSRNDIVFDKTRPNSFLQGKSLAPGTKIKYKRGRSGLLTVRDRGFTRE